MVSLILYDEELFANGLEMLLVKHNKSVEIVKESLKNDYKKLLEKQLFSVIYVIHESKNLDKIVTELQDYNPTAKIVAVIDKIIHTDVRRFKKLKLSAMFEKNDGCVKISNIIQLVDNGEKYFPANIVVKDKPLLSRKQMIILEMLGKGLSNKQIAYDANLAESTVKTHISNIMRLLKCTNRVATIRKAVTLGLINE